MYPASQPELIIALSRDKVTLNLSGLKEQDRKYWKTSFSMDGIFLNEQISRSLDQVLFENDFLVEHIPCVEIILVDRPHISVPRYYADNGQLPDIASRYLRLRMGDTLTSDDTQTGSVFCYTIPANTLQMLKEYYANIQVIHLASVLWQALADERASVDGKLICYTILQDTLIAFASKNNKLVFSKTFHLRSEADLSYYSLACSRLVHPDENWLITIDKEESTYDISAGSSLHISRHITLPSIHLLVDQFKKCGS